jgi:hypothetical protein
MIRYFGIKGANESENGFEGPSNDELEYLNSSPWCMDNLKDLG